MSKEKRAKPTPEFDTQRETRVLLEHIRSDVRTLSEQHGDIVKKLDNIESDVTTLKEGVSVIKLVLQDHTKDIQELKKGQLQIENTIKGVMSDHETRITKLEDKLTPI